jgi:membrane protease YdiL (CAAX protease family)
MSTASPAEEETLSLGVAPTMGLVLAGIALLASLLPWTAGDLLIVLPRVDGSAVAMGLALVATVLFAARRHGAVGRGLPSAVAGLCSLGVTGVALYRLVRPALGTGSTPSVELALAVAGLAGLGGAAFAVADYLALSDRNVWGKLKATSWAAIIGFLGYLASAILGNLLAVVPVAAGVDDYAVLIALLTTGSGVGMVLFSLGYLNVRNLGLEYIDIRVPDRWDLAYMAAGFIALYGSAIVVSVVFQGLGLPSSTSSIEELARDIETPVFLLVLVPMSFLAIGPGEELLYRNVVQKYLYESFNRRTAVLVASVAFGAIHFQQYMDPNPVAMLSTLFVVFVLSLVLGYTYYKTENLVVPIVIHGAFNAVQFYLLYLQLTGGLPGG